jgi:hypothetical protein
MARVLVRYKGIADIRKLTVADLAANGIKFDHDLVWSRSNRFQVELDAGDRFLALLEAQGSFAVEAITDDGNGLAESIVLPSNTAETGTMIFGPTGQTFQTGE